MVLIKGTARIGHRTKDLIKRLNPSDIAVIDHKDIDDVACESLVRSGVRAVINARDSISGAFPNTGPARLLEAGIYVLDGVGPGIFERISDGERIEVRDNVVIARGKPVATGRVLDRSSFQQRLDETKGQLASALDRFVQNTLEYARREKNLILGGISMPRVKTAIAGRQVVVVVRGHDYREDLAAIGPYIRECRPVLIGVDGGADALIEQGLRPDLIIGDMDSVSDRALASGAELVVHAYQDGRAPGLARLRRLGLEAHVLPAPGTSEDIALLLAYELGADLIVAVGTHSNMVDFLEKGRQGMASTFLVRLKVGPKLVDAKGVNKLYRGRLRASYVAEIALGAMVPLLAVLLISDGPRQLLRLIIMKFKVMLGIY
ncbi:MAG TPA: hypothetical protein GX506_09035 [Firmicutes bacterium]|nr:hypothetical protein [Bacillota bacterium]